MRAKSAARLAAILAGIALAAGCSAEAPTPTPQPADGSVRLDMHHTLGDPVTVANLTVWPVFTDEPLDIGEFRTLKEAQEEGTAEIREVGGEGVGDGPAVARLVVENKGELPLLICAGTLVTGGNQDRQLAQDVVVEAGQTVPVDVFCVEAGRWEGQREGTPTAGKFAVADTMSVSDVRASGQYENDQGAVWKEVARARSTARFRDITSAFSPPATGATTFVDLVDKVDEETVAERATTQETIRNHFDGLSAGDEAPVGFAYAVNGKAVTVRAFAHSKLLDMVLDDFIKTMTLEAELADEEDFEPATTADVIALVRRINEAAERFEETPAANTNGVRRNEAGFNSNCYFGLEDGRALTQDWTRR